MLNSTSVCAGYGRLSADASSSGANAGAAALLPLAAAAAELALELCDGSAAASGCKLHDASCNSMRPSGKDSTTDLQYNTVVRYSQTSRVTARVETYDEHNRAHCTADGNSQLITNPPNAPIYTVLSLSVPLTAYSSPSPPLPAVRACTVRARERPRRCQPALEAAPVDVAHPPDAGGAWLDQATLVRGAAASLGCPTEADPALVLIRIRISILRAITTTAVAAAAAPGGAAAAMAAIAVLETGG
jgi:hypothetical protein